MNIYKFELKMLRNNVLIWASGISFFIVFYMVFFPLIMVENDAMLVMMANFPEEFLAFFGMSSEISFGSLMGYYGLTLSFVYIPVAIQAATYGVSILSVEEREFTADFLLTKPISRKQIFIAKLLSALTGLTFVNICIWIFSFFTLIVFGAADTFDTSVILLLLSSIILTQLFFLSIGMLVSVLVKKVDSVIAYSMGIGFGLFIVSSFGSMLSMEILKVMSPYSYFEPIDMIVNKSYNILYLIICIAVIIISLTLGYFLYQKRNIKAL